ncbi:MAG: hypothetical protein JSU72_15135 [Deltaproteobacteria bacterium]|nr:MAG: hypothetical protein JSU72_15135 [Deltaproteobacteria bacterium]
MSLTVSSLAPIDEGPSQWGLFFPGVEHFHDSVDNAINEASCFLLVSPPLLPQRPTAQAS